jgi:anti-sigma factor RsiW
VNETERDDALHAYVDGQLAPAERAAVEARLRADPEGAASVAAWLRQNQLIRALHGGEEAIPDRLRAVLQPKPRALRWRSLVAGLSLFALGGLSGLALRDGTSGPFATPALAARSLEAHRVYVSEVRHPVEVGADEEAHLVQWLSKRLGFPITAPNLSGEGLRLLGGRLLPSEAGPAALLMYEAADGSRASLYFSREADPIGTAFRYAEGGDAAAFYWRDGPGGFAVVGPRDRERLLRVARRVYDAVEAEAAKAPSSRPL